MIPIRKFIIIFILLLFSLGASSLYAQTVGDYRSVANGLWSETTTWEVWNGTAWGFAGVPPGASTTPDMVTISHDITANIPMWEDLNNITVDAASTLTFSTYSNLRYRGTLTLNGLCPDCGTKLDLLALGDYRSSSAGDWSIRTNWQRYNGTTWAVPTVGQGYPGVSAPATSKVFLRIGTKMDLDVTPANELNRLVIEDGGILATNTCNALSSRIVNLYGSYAPNPGKLITLNAGDIRSTASGAWATAANWQEYDGTTWGAAPAEYPGETASPAQRDRDVIVRHTMTLGATITNPSGNIYVASAGTITTAGNDLTVTTLKNCGTVNNITNIVYGITNFRSFSSGDWSDITVWEASTDLGATWFSATQYPGETAPSTPQLVTIQAPHTVTLDISPFEDIRDLNVIGSMNVSNASSVRHRGTCTSCPAPGISTIAVSNGDYRSKATGNWGTNLSWEQYNGTAWVNATDYPGQNPVVGTPKIFTRASHVISLDLTPINETHTLIVESGSAFSINTCNNVKLLATPALNGTYSATSGKYIVISNGDFRSTAAGNWTSLATWQTFNGTTWVAAATYPGQDAASVKNVIISHAVALDATPIEDIQELFIETAGSLTISGLFNLRYRGAYTACGTFTAGAGGIYKVDTNDFRTVAGGGTWNLTATWERYNGSAWVAATIYPGQNPAAGENVFVRTGTTTVTATPPNGIDALILEQPATLNISNGVVLTAAGTVALYGTLILNATGLLNYSNIGDYRSIATGDWSNPLIWEKFSNTGWGASADYPGQNFSIIPPRVSIQTGHSVATDVSPLHDIQNVSITGTLTFTGTLGTDASTLRSRTAHTISGGTCAACPTNVIVIANGDYRSKATGNWEVAATWEKFVSNAWIDAPEAPGDIDPISNTSRIFIRNTHTVTLGQTPLNDIGRLFVEKGATYTISTVSPHSLRARNAISVNGTYTANGGNYFVVANGDYRSIASSNWSTTTTWERYNGTTWAGTAVYPGQDIASYGSVYIRRTHTVVHNLSPAEDINSFTIENGGTLNVAACNNLTLRGNFTVFALLGAATSPVLDNSIADRFIRIQNLDYRSNVVAGNWTTAGSWQKFVAGTWSAAPEAPGAIAPLAGQNVIIRTGHNITFNANPAFNLVDIYVLSGGTLTDGAATLIQINGRTIVDMECGTLTETGFVYVGDRFYRARATGNWSAISTWEVSTTEFGVYTAATDYPGTRQPITDDTPLSKVIIASGFIVTVDISPAEDIRSLQVNAGGTLTFPAAGTGIGHNIKVHLAGGINNAGTINNIHSNTGIINTGTINTVANTSTFTFIGLGAYRTAASGSWTNLNTWQIFDPSSKWLKPTQIPGSSFAGTQPIIIRTGHTITTDISMAPPPAAASIRNFVIENGATFNANANSNVNITGNFVNHGTFVPSAGAITFTSNLASDISGASLLANYAFYDLAMDRPSGTAVSTSKSFGIRNSFRNTGTATANVFLASSPSEITFNSGGTASISGVANIASGTFPATTFNNPISFFKLTLGTSTGTTVNVSTPIRVTDDLRLNNASRIINTSEIVITNNLSSDNNIGSVFTNATNGYLRYRSNQVPFVGAPNALDASTATNNMVDYDFAGSQTLYAASYHTLRATNGGTKTMDVGTTKYEVKNLFSISRGAVTTVRTDVIINGTTGRLLNFRADVGRRCNYTYNANTNTLGANNLPNLNGPGLSANNFASNFSGRFNSIYISDDDQQNSISSSNLNDIRLERGGSGSMRAVRSVAIPDVPQAAVVRFDVVGASNSSVVTDAAFMLIGNALADNDVVTGANVASRISFGFNNSNQISLVHQGTSNTAVGGAFVPNTTTSRRRVAWFINTSGSLITYTNPSGGTNTLANNTVDIWIGTTRNVVNAAVANNGVSLNSLKMVFNNGSGNFTLENIRINPIALLTVNNYTQVMLSGSASPLCVPTLPYVISTPNPGTDAGYTTVASSAPNSAYNPNNQFLIQLSRPDGSFTQFTQIGALTSTNPSSIPNVLLTIPQNILPTMATGSAFRIRVVSTDPPMVSTPSTNNLVIRSYSIVRNSDNVVPDLQAVTTTAPNQLTQLLRVNGIPTPVPVGTTYQWSVRFPATTGTVYAIDGATAITFQANGTLSDNDGTPSPSGTPGIHFHAGTGLYDLFCDVTIPVGVGGCGTVRTSSVPVIVECTGCTKNPRPYANCVKNLVFNSTLEAGVWGGNRTSGDATLDTPVFPATMPNPDDPNSEGMIPFETTDNPYGGIVPEIKFSPYSIASTFGNLAAPNAAQVRRQKTRTYILANGQTATLRLNTPYGFSTEYGGVNVGNRQSDMSLETNANPRKGGGTMAPENQWAMTANPRFYMGDVCDADGTDANGFRTPAGGDGLWGTGARGTTWNYTQAPPNSPVGTTLTGVGNTIAPHGRGGPPFTRFPIQVTSYGAGNNPMYGGFAPIQYPYNSSPSGGRLEIANGDYGTAAKMWTQRFKVRKNTDYVFSFWAVNLNSISAIYGIFANCSQVGNNLLLEGDATRCVWRQYTFLWNSGDLSTVEFSVRNISTVRSGNDIGIDDIMFYRCDGNTNLFPSSNRFVWRGFNTDWFNPDNWGNCVLPDCESDVIIPAESTNPAASTLLGTYFMPIIQSSANTVIPNAYTGGHPAYDLTNARNINTRNLAKVKKITIEHGATLTIQTEAGNPWNLDICGDLIAKKNAAADPDIVINWLNPLDNTDTRSSITFTSTAAQAATVPLVPTIISGDFKLQGAATNQLPTFIVRKQSVNQIVQLDDDLEVHGDLVIVDGTLDANGKDILFRGGKFVNGSNSTADAVNNPKSIGNTFFRYPPLLPISGEGNGPNTTSGASFVHNAGTVTFQALSGDQTYYKRAKTLCPACEESFYNLIINQTAFTTNLEIIRGDLIIDNNLRLSSGYIVAKPRVGVGAREVYITNPDATASLTLNSTPAGRQNSYVVTTNDTETPTEVNLKFRREVNGLDFATKDYVFPIGGDGSGNPNTGTLQGYRELTFRQTVPLSGASSIRAYFDARNSSAAYATPKLPGARADACAGNNLTYDLCTGGYWDLKPLDISGVTVLPTGINYNLTMPSIPAAFTCTGSPTLTTFAKRTDEADNWGFGASCYINPQTRNGFTTFTKFAPVSTVSPLPVEFLSFDAFKNNQTVDVKWETISERNSSHFVVQRSADGKNFVPIGRVEAKGNTTSTVKYLFVDTKPVQGINYYRLLQVDLDNKETLTKVVSITFNGDGADLQVFPNPSSEGVAFNVILPASITGSDVEMRMTDALGRQMFYQRFRFEGGVIQLPADFAKGLYTLTIATPKENYVRKLIIK